MKRPALLEKSDDKERLMVVLYEMNEYYSGCGESDEAGKRKK